MSVPFSYLGHLDETWVFRSTHHPLAPKLHGLEGILGFAELDGPYALVRTLARDAVERERILRGVHKALGDRPLRQVERAPAPPLKRKPTKEDWALVAALRKHPWGAAEVLAREAKLPPRPAKEKLARLVAERVVTLDASPIAEPLARVIVRVSPSSNAAARRALEAIGGVIGYALPVAGEASYVDALVMDAATALDKAREVPGVSAVDAFRVRAEWTDEALIDRSIRGA